MLTRSFLFALTMVLPAATTAVADSEIGLNFRSCSVTGGSPTVKNDTRGVLINRSQSSEMVVRCGFGRLTTSSPTKVTLFHAFGTYTRNRSMTCGAIVWGWNGSYQWSREETSISDSDAQHGQSLTFTIPQSATGYVVAYCRVPPWNGSATFGFVGARLGL